MRKTRWSPAVPRVSVLVARLRWLRQGACGNHARRSDLIDQVVTTMHGKGLLARACCRYHDVVTFAALITRLRPFDVFVNSAGLARHTPALDTKPDDFDAVMNVNLRGAYFAVQAAAQAMIDDGRAGSIITISSQMAMVGGVDRAVYCGSKHGVEGFTKAMAVEFGQYGVRVNTICPTFIRTPLTEQTFSRPDRVRWIEEKIKLGRVGEIEDIMGAVQFLASDASALVTGTALIVDGGWTAE